MANVVFVVSDQKPPSDMVRAALPSQYRYQSTNVDKHAMQSPFQTWFSLHNQVLIASMNFSFLLGLVRWVPFL